MKTGILGGSFNPPHPGHIRAALGALEYMRLDRVIMIPAGEPPHKELSPGSPTPRQRLELCKIAAADYPQIEVSDIELQRDGKSYTADTLAALKELYPEDELFLLMGTDMFLTFDKWYRPEEICRLADIAFFFRERDDEARKEEMLSMTAYIIQKLGGAARSIPLDFIETSSTTVRRLIAFGCGEDCLDKRVYDYIEKNDLYSINKNRKGLSLDQLWQDVSLLMKPKRLPHVEGCRETAERLALRWGEDAHLAQRAAILHDITKALKFPEQLILSKKYGIIGLEEDNGGPAVAHAFTGAEVARYIYGEAPEVCSAIKWHTTGRVGMTDLDKIIFLADYTEPNRSFPEAEQCREITFKSLDSAMIMALENTLNHLGGKKIFPTTNQAYDWFVDLT